MTRMSALGLGSLTAVFVSAIVCGCGQTSGNESSGGTVGSGAAGATSGGGGSAQGGTGGVVVAPFFCGVDTCTGNQKCCQTTGHCYDPNSGTGCGGSSRKLWL